MKYIIALLIWCCLLLPQANASHVHGVTISYNHISDSVFDFYFHFYRSCNGVAFTNPSSSVQLKCLSSGDSTSLNLSLQSITDVSLRCISVAKPCNPVNTASTGEGLEEHVYKARIDFTKSQYKSFYACGELIVETKQCCRPGYITGIPPGLYAYAQFNPSQNPKNSSPKFDQPPRLAICCNMPTKLNFEATDVDGDSLSYNLAEPLSMWNKFIKYGSGLSATKPLSVYNPTGKGTVDPNANPPIGFYLDGKNGQIVFTPTSCAESSTMVVVVKEWRKDTAGKYQQIGTMMADVFLQVNTCKPNNIPTFTGETSYYLCEGDSLTFVIGTNDIVVVPPPPATKPAPDSVAISWNNGIKGASFKVLSDTALHQSAVFEWRTPKGSESNKPYSFLVFAKDNNCPMPATNFKRINVYVNKNLAKSKPAHRIDCGAYELQSNYDTNSRLPNLQWTILDQNGTQIVDLLLVSFKSNKSHVSSAAKDTLTFLKSGTYYVKMSASVNACSDVVFDTIITNGVFDVIAMMDTSICLGNNFSVVSDPNISGEIAKYEWSYNGNTQTGKVFSGVPTKGKSRLTVRAESHDGCEHFDTVTIHSIYQPKPKSIADTAVCNATLTNLTAVDLLDSGFVKNQFLWSFGDTTKTISQFFKTGIQWVNIQNQCGSNTDSFFVQADSLYTPKLVSDTILCDKDSFLIGNRTPQVGVAYFWNTGANTSFIQPKTDGLYILTTRNSCGAFSDSVLLSFQTSPKLNWPDTTVYCNKIDEVIDAGNIGSTYVWHDGSIKRTYLLDKTGWFSLKVTADGCSTTDSSYADLVLSPVVDLGNDTMLVKPFDIILDGGSSDATYLWNTNETTQTIHVTDYGVYWVQHLNACDTVRDSISVSLKMGITTPDNNKLTIQPNPTSGKFVIHLDNLKQINFRVFNDLGQLVKFNSEIVNGNHQVNLLDPIPGVYFLQIYVEGDMVTKRLVVF